MTIATNGNNQAIFEILDSVLAQTMPRVFGLWTTGNTSLHSGVSFSSPFQQSPAVPIWRVSLPQDLDLASRSLVDAETHLAASQAALEFIPDRINQLAVATNDDLQQQIVFAVSSTKGNLKPSEKELLVSLRSLYGFDTAQSYSLGEGVSIKWSQATQQFQTLMQRMLRIVDNYAWIETCIEQKLQARTIVSWMGDFDTVWSAKFNSSQIELHNRSVVLAIASRNTLIRTFALAAQGAIKFSVLAATPGGTILAVPTLWRFINQVLAEVK